MSFPDPTAGATPWCLRSGFVAGIPAIPWIMPCLFGVLLPRRAGDEPDRRRRPGPAADERRRYDMNMPTNQPLHDDDTSGRVEFLDGGIVCFPKHGPSVSIPLADLKVVGEYTTACGPFVDDYWLVFVLRNGSWVESSFYAAGRDRLLQGLGQALDCTLRPQLASSTSLASNVLWPPAITGEHLFEFSPAPRSGAGGAGLQLAGAQQMNAVLTMAVAGQLVQR